jgi:hypothetical protein
VGALQQILFGKANAIVAALKYALVRQTVGTDAVTAGTPMVWDAEVADTDAWHDNVTNNTRLTVPSGVSLVRFTTNAQAQASITDLTVIHRKNDALIAGLARQATVVGSGQTAINVTSALIEVAPGDYFTTNITQDSLTTPNEAVWSTIEAVTDVTSRCLVTKAGAEQPLTGGVTALITFDTEVYDVGGWFNPGAPTELVVPSGVNYARFSGNWRSTTTVAGEAIIAIDKNGVFPNGTATRDVENGSGITEGCNTITSIMPVVAGEIFRVSATHTSATAVANLTSTWFCAEGMASVNGASAYKNSTQALTANVEAAVALDGEVFDTGGYHDNSVDNSRITVPSGVSYARVSFCLTSDSSSSAIIAGRVFKNGAAFYGSPRCNSSTTSFDRVGGIGAWVPVVAGDYFQLMALATQGQTLPATGRTWLCVEFK